jgi:hypothetical protein
MIDRKLIYEGGATDSRKNIVIVLKYILLAFRPVKKNCLNVK